MNRNDNTHTGTGGTADYNRSRIVSVQKRLESLFSRNEGNSAMTWQLWRQDDNGNQFLVGDFAAREVVESKMAELARGRHKQIYWISETRERGETDTGGSYR